jgi:hypothetical protein
MKRLARAVALALVTAVALSGCIRYDVDMTLSSDNTASGTIVIAVQKGVGEQMGLTSDQDALTQLFGESPFGPNFTPKEYKDGDWVGKSFTFSGVAIDNLADLASIFTVTRDGDRFSVEGAGAPVTEDEKTQLPPGAESRMTITFPGPVIESNGTIDGNSVTWDLFAMTDPVHATAKATAPGSGSSLGTWVLIGGGAALAVLIGVAIFVLVRRRRNPSAPTSPEPIDWGIPTATSPPVVEEPSPAPPPPPAVEEPSPAPPPPPVVEEQAPAPKKRAPRTAKPKVTPHASPNPDDGGDK